MRESRGQIHHRVKGKAAIVRSLRGLLIRVHRFGRARATTPADRRWTAMMLDALQVALDLDTRDEKADTLVTPRAGGQECAR